MNEPFWVVWRTDRYKHSTFQSARSEAERLARKEKGCEFFILQAIGKVKAVDVQYTPLTCTEDDSDF
mgnify:CR=1 FL=1